MAQPSTKVIHALREAARKLGSSSNYQWGHMGLCNCGFLAQEVTHLSKEEIHRRAMMRHGDWSEQLNDYCPSSGLPMDDMISDLITFGFDASDLKHLEYLSDDAILMTLPFEQRHLMRNVKGDAVIYLSAWANLLENQLLDKITLPSIDKHVEVLA
ncbi:MAG TPA: hypothetical protein VG737_16390 [Cyclobacteriaceae bacterium]|nr:hypothetical protein [Cyclobacteriaceae bacterium]